MSDHTINRTSNRRILLAVAALAVALTAVTGCSSDSATTAATNSKVDSVTTPISTTQASAVEATEVWAKAAPTGQMSAMFGTLTNTGKQPVTIVSASAPESAEMQLHMTVMGEDGSMKMQEKEAGFTLEPGQTLTLEPGGDHLMYMGLVQDLKAGADATVRITFADDSTLDLTGAVREYAGAQEEYVPDHSMDGMDADHDHSDH